MRILKRILFEMSVSDALDLFGMSQSELGDKEAIKKKYRQLSIKYHPDRGGDIEMMKKVNDAKATLDKASPGATSSGFDWESMNKKYQELGARIKKLLLDGFKPEKYISYFSKIYNEDFKYEILQTWPRGSERSPSFAGFKSEFFNKDRSIVFELDITSYLANASSSTSLGSADKYISFPLTVTAFGFYNNRKLKVSQRDWKSTSDHKILIDPELAFPRNKLEKFKKTSSTKAFKKKDMITYLTKKLKGSWDGQWVKIPLEGDHKLYLQRSVIMRTAGWSPIVFERFKAVPGGVYITFPETLETAQYFENLVKGTLKKRTGKDMVKYIHDELKKEKQKRKF